VKSTKRKIIEDHEDLVSINDKEAWKRVPSSRNHGSGVYALYNNYGLYYIGKANTSLKSRLRRHKQTKKKKWNRYSWYQTKNYAHAKELESILLRLVNPPANKIQARGIGKRKQERLFIK